MKRNFVFIQLISFGIASLLMSFAHAADSKDPLPSWNDTDIKRNIIKFVTDVTDKTGKHFVDPEDRIATIDNDGTLWIEKPIYTQGVFMLDRIKKLAPEHPEWKTEEPYSYILDDDIKALTNLTVQDIERLIAVTHSRMSVDQFNKIVKIWLKKAKNPQFDRPYTELIYLPMIEVINYLYDNDFKIYIVTGGGQDFVRAFSENTYKIPPENIIGSSIKTEYTYQGSKPILIKLPELFLVSDKKGKAEAINLFIGKKPIIAFGNSDGDREMLEWTESNKERHLMLLVHHDDAKREYAYGPESKVGTFSNALMAEARSHKWNVISMKHDWKTIFP